MGVHGAEAGYRSRTDRCEKSNPGGGRVEWEPSEKSKMLERMAGATGLEPATFGVTGRRSNQLSYAPAGVERS